MFECVCGSVWLQCVNTEVVALQHLLCTLCARPLGAARSFARQQTHPTGMCVRRERGSAALEALLVGSVTGGVQREKAPRKAGARTPEAEHSEGPCGQNSAGHRHRFISPYDEKGDRRESEGLA